MKIKRARLSACVVAALLTGTAACTSEGSEPGARAERTAGAACRNGTYTWFNVDKRDVLTGVAEKQELGKGGGRLTHALTALHTPRVAVTFEKGPKVEAEAVLRSLGVHMGEMDAPDSTNVESVAFTDLRRSAPDLNSGATSVHGAGTFAEFAWVRQVTADFQYACGAGERVRGRATNWLVEGSGVVECSEEVKKAGAGEPAVAAARISCGPDAPAARTTTTG
ncbi:hypothetical protein [Streptomyces sp. NPDC054887]